MSTPRGAGWHPSAMDLDQAELGLLDEDRRRELAAHVLGCGRCAELQQTVQRAASRFRAEVAPRTLPRVLAMTEGRAARLRTWWSTASAKWRWTLLATPVAAALLLTVGPLAHKEPRPGDVDREPAVSEKGPPALRVFVRRGDRVFPGRSGEALAAGDAVRFMVEPRGHRFLLLVSIDGAGKVSVYHPFQGTMSAPLGADPRVELPGSIVLDRAPGPERIFAIFSDEALSTTLVRGVLEPLAAAGQGRIRQDIELPLPGTEQASFLVEKTELPR